MNYKDKFYKLHDSCYETGTKLYDICEQLGIKVLEDENGCVYLPNESDYEKVVKKYMKEPGAEFSEALRQFAEEYEYSFRGDYSGRFMYGKCCPGVVGGRSMAGEFVEWLYENDMKKFVKKANNSTWDNMGLNMIMYYPQFDI